MDIKEGLLDDLGPPGAEPAPKIEEKPEKDEPAPATTETKSEAKPERIDPANSPARPDGYVPKQALEQTRAELAEARRHAQILEERTNKILERYFKEEQPQAEQIDPPGEEPNAEESPYDWILWRQKADRFAARQSQQQNEHRGNVERVISAQTARFSAVQKEHPVLSEAYDGLLQSWSHELAMQGFQGNDLKNRVNQLETQWAIWAHNNGRNIEDVIWHLAQSRGWRAPAPPAADGAEKAAEATETAASDQKRDPSTGQFVSAEEKAAKIKTGQERNGSLSQAPGAPVEKMTAKELASLPEEEMWRRFDSVKNSKGRKDFDRRMNFTN